MKPLLNTRTSYRAGAALLFALFAYVVVFSNHDDWDFFFSTFEVDLRSWLIDHRAPLWSYQLCAGSTRLGDPQAFGLSPLFLPVLIFGSFWGAKALALLCCALGYFSLSRLLALLATGGEKPEPEVKTAIASLSLFVILGNFVVCHVFAGQLTFLLFPFVLVIAHLAVRICMEGWRLTTALGLFLAAFAYLTGGLYHSLVFLVVPGSLMAALAGLVFLARARRFPSRAHVARAALVAGLLALALLASAFKLAEVSRYQREFSRVVSMNGIDTNSLLHMLAYFFLPTVNFKFGGVMDSLESWGPFEFSAFSFVAWAFAFSVFWLLRARGRGVSLRALWLPELVAAGLLGVLFCLGDSTPVSPHRWLNALLYNGSVRVVGRYHLLLLLVAAVFLARLLFVSPAFRRTYLRWLLPAGLLAHALSLATFLPLTDLKRFSWYSSLPVASEAGMETLVRVTPRILGERTESFMYPGIRLGGIVLNCYQAINRETRVASESEITAGAMKNSDQLLSVFETATGPLREACEKSISVTQNEIYFDHAACSAGVCFRLNMRNPYVLSELRFDDKRHLFCAGGPINASHDQKTPPF